MVELQKLNEYSSLICLTLQARFYEQPGTKVCAAFLASNNSKEAETVKFMGQEYYLPARSISILPDCKNVVYNTMTVIPNLLHVSIDNCLKLIIGAAPKTD